MPPIEFDVDVKLVPVLKLLLEKPEYGSSGDHDGLYIGNSIFRRCR